MRIIKLEKQIITVICSVEWQEITYIFPGIYIISLKHTT